MPAPKLRGLRRLSCENRHPHTGEQEVLVLLNKTMDYIWRKPVSAYDISVLHRWLIEFGEKCLPSPARMQAAL